MTSPLCLTSLTAALPCPQIPRGVSGNPIARSLILDMPGMFLVLKSAPHQKRGIEERRSSVFRLLSKILFTFLFFSPTPFVSSASQSPPRLIPMQQRTHWSSRNYLPFSVIGHTNAIISDVADPMLEGTEESQPPIFHPVGRLYIPPVMGRKPGRAWDHAQPLGAKEG